MSLREGCCGDPFSCCSNKVGQFNKKNMSYVTLEPHRELPRTRNKKAARKMAAFLRNILGSC